MEKIKKNTILLAIVFSALGFILGFMWRAGGEINPLTKPESGFSGTEDPALRDKYSLSSDGTPRLLEGRALYTLCGHWEPLSLGDFEGKDIDDLKKSFPPEQGWHIEETGNKIIVTKDIKALCPKDEKKRHLGSFGEYIAVIKGPPGVNGGIIEVTELKIKDLPSSFQREAEQGTLDFSSAQNLLEALDSLDEYEN